MTFYEITKEDKMLIEKALEIMKKTLDTVTLHHTVGCALLCKNGKIYTGVNCDGIHGSCAEYTAMGAAVCAGEKEFDTIVAVHRKAPNFLFAPCGNCRQMLHDYAPDIKVILNDDENNVIKVGIKDLLPFAWKDAE